HEPRADARMHVPEGAGGCDARAFQAPRSRRPRTGGGALRERGDRPPSPVAPPPRRGAQGGGRPPSPDGSAARPLPRRAGVGGGGMSEERPAAVLADVGELTVRIEKLVAGGEGLARYEGLPLFVPRAAPGDRLRVRLVERRPDYGRAEIVEVVEPGPGRRPDPYPELARTGACDLQHIDDALQPRLKAAAVRETIERLGKVTL